MNSDWGLKISLPGVDVKTATPEQCSVHSSFDSFKVQTEVATPNLGNVKVTFIDNPPNPQTFPVLTVPHNLGFKPATFMFYDITGSSQNLSSDVGTFFFLDSNQATCFQITADTQNMYITFVLTIDFILNYGTYPLVGNYFSFRYYIFANDGI